MKIKAIIWDIGGVLERTEDLAPRQQLAERLGMSYNDLCHLIFGDSTEFRVQLGKISLDNHYHFVQEQLGMRSRADFNEVIHQFFAGDHLDTELVDHIRALKPGYTTAVLSNYSEVLREKINNWWKIGDAFDHLVISAEVGYKKPSPEIYRIVLEKIGCQPEEAVFIDDDARNIETARQLGIHGIHFQDPDQALNELNDLLKG
jgi:epoxide hydrolase-like predicted phosphatase